MAEVTHRGMLRDLKKQSSGWKVATYVLGIALVFTGWKMLEVKNAQAVVIAPYGLYSANQAVATGDTLEEARDYMDLLFRADLSVMLNWQASTVSRQFSTFMTRLTPEGYAHYNLDLRDKGVKYRDQNMSQMFYPQDISMIVDEESSGSFVMESEGLLKRWRGGDELINTEVVYRLHYREVGSGLFGVKKIETSYERTPSIDSNKAGGNNDA
jgi:hypothetical protein